MANYIAILNLDVVCIMCCICFHSGFCILQVKNRSAEFLKNTELLSAYVAQSVQSGNMNLYYFSGSNIGKPVC